MVSAKPQEIGLHQTMEGYVVRRYTAGNKLLSERRVKTLKAADKAVVEEKRKALKITKQQPKVYGLAKATKTIRKKKVTRSKPKSKSMFGFTSFRF